MKVNEDRIGRWYFGGLSGSVAVCFTHPLDLMKVHLQTQQKGKITIPRVALNVYKSDGIGGFYSGLSASILRQMTYSLTRFGCYEALKKQLPNDKNIPFYQKVALAGISGAVGGLVGNPADVITVRMQSDMKMPLDQRRNYRNAVDGIFRIAKEERVRSLFRGVSMNVTRASLMTIGQLSFYDQVKQMLVESGLMGDNIYTHLFSSFVAASAATIITSPADVIKTLLMNAKPGEYKSAMDCVVRTAKTGPTAFFKGLVPAFVRMGPHTILLFVIYEQFRKNFGYIREIPQKQYA